MSELIVIGDDDKATAEAAAAKVGERSEQALVRLEKAAVVSRDAEGKVKADPPAGLVHAGAYGGMVWGSRIGRLFLTPIAGLAAFGGEALRTSLSVGDEEQLAHALQAAD